MEEFMVDSQDHIHMQNRILRAALAVLLLLWISPHAYAKSVRAPDPFRFDVRGEGIYHLEASDTIAGLETEALVEAGPGQYDLMLFSPQGSFEEHRVEVSSSGKGALSLSPLEAGGYTLRGGGEEATFTVYAAAVSPERSRLELQRMNVRPGETVRGEVLLQDRYGNPVRGWPVVVVNTGEGTVSLDAEQTDDKGVLAFTYSSPLAGGGDLFALNPITGEQLGEKVSIVVSETPYADSFRVQSYPPWSERAGLPPRIVGAGGTESPVEETPKSINLLASLLKRMAELEEEGEQGERALLNFVHHFEFDRAEMPKVVQREQPFDIILIAKRADGGVDTGFVGEVEIMSGGDDGAQFNKRVAFLPSDRGRKKLVLGVAFSSLGKQVVQARLLDDLNVTGEHEILVIDKPVEAPLVQNITIKDPKGGTEIDSREVTLRGNAPPFIDLQVVVNGVPGKRFSSFGDEEAEERGYGYEVMVTLPEEETEFEIFLEQVGGLELASNVVQVHLDTTGPEILAISVEPTDVVAGESIRVQMRADSDGEAEVELDGMTTTLNAMEWTGGVVTYEATLVAPTLPGEYTLAFIARDRAGNDSREETKIAILPPPLPAPRNLRLVLEGADAVLSWEPTAEAQGYMIYFGADSLSLDRTLRVDARTPKARVQNLERGRPYTFVVTAVDAEGRESSQSNVVTVSIPAELQYITVEPVLHGVEFRWEADVPGAPAVAKIEYGIAEGALSELRLVPFSLGGTVIADLIDGMGYFFSVSFLNEHGVSAVPPERFEVTPGVFGLTGFHPVAGEEITLPPPSVLSREGSPSAADPSMRGRREAQQRPRPLLNTPTGALGVSSLALLFFPASLTALALRAWRRKRKEQQFLLMMEESYAEAPCFSTRL
jgi:hypothetical protein